MRKPCEIPYVYDCEAWPCRCRSTPPAPWHYYVDDNGDVWVPCFCDELDAPAQPAA